MKDSIWCPKTGDEKWWQMKHMEDCGTLAQILHIRTKELLEVKKELARVLSYLESIPAPTPPICLKNAKRMVKGLDAEELGCESSK
jgi:hypothetical protein